MFYDYKENVLVTKWSTATQTCTNEKSTSLFQDKTEHNKKGFVFFKSRLYCWTVLQFFTWMNHCFGCHKAFNKKFLSTNAWREITVFLIYNFKSLLIIYIIFLNILMSIHTWSIKELRNLFMALYALVLCSKVFADESKNLAGPRLWKKKKYDHDFSGKKLPILNNIYKIKTSHLLLLGFHESYRTAVSFFLRWKSEMSGHLCLVTNLSDYTGFPTQLKQLLIDIINVIHRPKKVKSFSFPLFHVYKVLDISKYLNPLHLSSVIVRFS